MLSALNTARRSDGQGPLVISESLCRAALSHARDLAGQGLVGHRGTDGSTPAMRAPRTGFDGRVLGEVVARAPDHEVSVLRDWLDQPESRAVLLDPQARQMGVARHVTPDGMGWWVLLVGTGGDQG
ncbi:Putative transmembrane protein [Roseibacterium elongatum DSM 19469]|uniref:Putative transmembrane protein n=1 Tax=Roseicyclus elongatus DSM 19469 TaxID=1294273 RepID=W8S3P9_9RHOB|nr:CAP domain-containing protein [Roseibacterium elongatum]AHM03386.1 Putative transmembrane protein [Roseibacterium elongatum DSM 19469]